MQALEDISKTKIVVVGDVMLDRYWWGSVERISPEAPVPVVRLDDMSLVAGGAANVASNLAGLGATPFLFGIRGDDSEGEQMERVLIESEIKNSFMTSVPGRKTTIKTRIVAHHQHVVRIDQETHEPISNQIADEILGQISAVIDDIDVVVLSDYAKGVLSDRLLNELIRTAREKSKIVVVDPKGNDFAKYAGANVITPNKREAALATKLDPTSVDAVSRAGGSIMDSLGLDAVLITEGENGMTLFQAGQEPFHLDSLAQDVFDVTGAGDTVIATFAAAVAAGNNFVDSAKLANAAAGIVVGKVGTTRVTGRTLADFLAADGRHHMFESLHA